MIESLLVVGQQVLILFILIAIGFAGGKLKFITKNGVACITDIMLYIVTPCVIVNAFQTEFDAALLAGFIKSFLAAVAAHVISIILSKIFIKSKDNARKRVLQFGAVFSNCGFMSLPLLDALLGSEGVFYGASYIAVFNLLVWSYGLLLMDKEHPKLSVKKLIFNPGTLPVIIGLLFFFCSIKLPTLIGTPVSYLAALNTPVPMLVIGYYISNLKLSGLFKGADEFIMLFLRLVASPLLLLAVLYPLGFRGSLLISCIVSACAPVAATSTMFSIKFHADAELSAGTVAVSTIISIVTITLIVGATQYLAYL